MMRRIADITGFGSVPELFHHRRRCVDLELAKGMVLSFAELSPSPQCAQIAESYNQDQQTDWQPKPCVCQGEVDRVVSRRVVEEDADNCAEGRREERRKPKRKAHQQAGEQA